MADDSVVATNQYRRVPIDEHDAVIKEDDSSLPPSAGLKPVSSSRVRTTLELVLASLVLYFLCPWVLQRNGSHPASVIQQYTHAVEDFAPSQVCAPAYAEAPKSTVESVWTSLTVEEVVQIRAWLFEPAQGFNLTSGEVAEANDNYIEIIEAYYPPKQATLDYFAGKGPKPLREARAVLVLGGDRVPTVKNFVISPVPIVPNVTIVRFLDDIYHRPIIPHNARTFAPNDSLFKVLHELADGLGRVTNKLFGGFATGNPFNDTLMIAGSGPWSFDGTWRRTWLQWKRNVPGDFLNPLNFFQYVDVSGTDSSLWKTTKIVYNQQIFNSKAEFVEAFDNKTLKIDSEPVPIDPNWADRRRKGPSRDLDHLEAPRSVPFGGLRFKVDRENQHIEWMGFDFFLGFSRDMGLSLWNIKFLGDRIAYELAPHEALAQYAGDDPHQATTAWLDRYFGMGALAYEMVPGYDCPTHAVFLPSMMHGSIGSMLNPRAICVFEKDMEKPLNRHRGRKLGESGVVKDVRLVVRSITTVGNYDYMFDYVFMLDGSIEVRVSASGYLQGGYWDPLQEQHGTRINHRSMGTLHDHVINFKVDLDVVNEKNSFLEKTTKVRDIAHPWLDEDWGPTTRQQVLVSRWIETENESRLNYPPNFQGAFSFVNKDELNAWGVPRGYGIYPGSSPIFNTVVGSKRMLNNANFAKHNLAVTRRKETEPSSSSAWNGHLPGAPPVDFDLFFDGESLDQEDLVAWVNVGMHHFPGAEDVPNTRMNVATSSFVLSPVNFHDMDVSMASSNAVHLIQDYETGKWSVDEYGVEKSECAPPKREPLHYGLETLWDLSGRIVDQDATTREPWLRENQFPHAQDNRFRPPVKV